MTNSNGSDIEEKSGYITVTGNYYVYADGVGIYYDPDHNAPLWWANKTPIDFYDHIAGKQGSVYPSIYWAGIGKPVDNATGSRNWNINQDANTMANNADFAFHAGHGWNDGLKFGTANNSYDLDREDLRFGGNNGRAKWVALFSCSVLNQSTYENWESMFDGLHILMAFDTPGKLGEYQGSQFADRMTGSDIYTVPAKIRDSWIQTL